MPTHKPGETYIQIQRPMRTCAAIVTFKKHVVVADAQTESQTTSTARQAFDSLKRIFSSIYIPLLGQLLLLLADMEGVHGAVRDGHLQAALLGVLAHLDSHRRRQTHGQGQLGRGGVGPTVEDPGSARRGVGAQVVAAFSGVRRLLFWRLEE